MHSPVMAGSGSEKLTVRKKAMGGFDCPENIALRHVRRIGDRGD